MPRKLDSPEDLNYEKLQIGKVGVVPVVCIDVNKFATEGLAAYKMQAFANKRAVEIIFSTRKATFFSRQRNGLWTKGEESGNFLIVRSVFTDCDFDSLLLDVDAIGPTCHNGTNSCFELPTIGK